MLNFTAFTFNELNFNLQGSQAYILDDIIDYVKYLQIQVKVPFRSFFFFEWQMLVVSC